MEAAKRKRLEAAGWKCRLGHRFPEALSGGSGLRRVEAAPQRELKAASPE